MEANLVGGEEVAKPKREFPYANWGPWAAILGVFAALAIGLFLSVPALIVGDQEGKIEALFPPRYAGGASFDKGDATALAVDSRANRLFADHEDEVRVFGARGQEVAGARIGGIEGSRGLAFDPLRRTLFVAEQGPGRILYYAVDHGTPRRIGALEAKALPPALRGFEPERIATAPDIGGLYAIDAADEEVLRFDAKGEYQGALAVPGASSPGSLDLGSEDNDIAVDTARGPGRGDVFVLSGKGDGKVFAFSPAGKFRWELEPDSGEGFASLAVDGKGNLWIAEPDGDTYEYGRAAGAAPPRRDGGEIEAGSSPSSLEFAGSGHLFVARELDGTLTTAGSIISQLATELGFLLVPFALASMFGSTSLGRSLRRLGFRAFRPSAFGWMALTFVLYLAFTIFYSLAITEPRQKDIAESFGPTVVQVLLIVIAAPIAEETCFRGMLFGGLRQKLPRLAAALVCGLIFGGLHALTGVTAVPPLIVFGFLLALLYERTGSIVPGILLHMINNSIALLGQ
ncbi:MAG TPA: CPBP family glutamic-type intramembrane protease [Solirubrobacterales bacterium]|nr:CPBP family glutamic-type intramembrane protease [Solirubrobacterales bacterium]